MREPFTDEQVEQEIARLRESDAVKLAAAEERVRHCRRKYMYNLRNKEKRGLELMAQGFTMDDFYPEEA